MVFYLSICAFSLLAGYGALALFRFDASSRLLILAAPGVSLAAAATALVVGIGVGLTLTTAAMIIAATGSVLTCVWATRLWIRRPHLADLAIVAAACLCPLLLLFPFFRWGLTSYPGSWLWDGWKYVVHGQYLLDASTAHGAADGSYLSRYVVASGLSVARFSAAALLGVLGLLTGHDARGGFGPMMAGTTFAFACSSGFAAAALGRSRVHVMGVILIAGTGLWMLGVVQANNLDTLLLLSIAPLLFGLTTSAVPTSLAGAVLVGTIVAATLCIQVELAGLVFVAPALALVQRIGASERDRHEWLRWIVVSLVVAVIVSAPWLPKALPFLANQFAASGLEGGARPGNGYFLGLFVPQCVLPAMWGFWGPFEACGVGRYHLAAVALAIVYTLTLTIGLVRYLRRGEVAAPVAACVLIGGALFMMASRHYDYGAYKFLASAWCLTALLVVEGVAAIVALAAPRRHQLALALGVGLLLAGQTALLSARLARLEAATPIKAMSYFSQVRAVSETTQGPILVAVNDPLSLEWALFYLRYNHIVPVAFTHPYIAGTEHQAAFAAPLAAAIPVARYILSDAGTDFSCAATLVWQGGPYRLWSLNQGGGAVVVGIQNPNGLETVNGQKFLWIGGTTPTRLRILSAMRGRAQWRATIGVGPSLPPSTPRTLENASSDERVVETVEARGRNELSIPVAQGLTETTVRVIEGATESLPNGDPRPLLIYMYAYETCLNVLR